MTCCAFLLYLAKEIFIWTMHLRNSLPIAICIVVLLGFLTTSCGDIEHHVVLKPNGSGTMETSFDMGEMMSMIQGFDDMGTEDITISDSIAEPEEQKPSDPMDALIKRVTDPTHDKDFDTTFTLLSIMPDSVKQKQKDLKMAEKINVRMRSPALSSSLIIGMVMSFDNPEQLQDIVKYLAEMESAPGVMESASPGGLQPENFISFDIDMKAGWIKIDPIDYTAAAAEMGMVGDSTSAEDMGMIEMMVGSTKIRSIFEVPGDVKSCTNKDAILTKDNKVIVEYGFLDALKKGKVEGYTIHFTPGK